MAYSLPYLKYKNKKIESRAVLAPMAGVTDIPFRKMVRKWSKDCLVYTEMINSVIFVNTKKTSKLSETTPEDDPIIYQFSGNDPYYIAKAAEKAQLLGAFGVDINLGCPMTKIVKKGNGCSLLKDIEKTKEIFESAVKSVDIPISVKIRAGWDDDSIIAKEYAQLAESSGLAAIAIHARTRNQLYNGLANWDYIKEAQDSVNIPVLGSGDLWKPEDGKRMVDHTGCAGLWVARGCIGNPWIVSQMDSYLKTGEIYPKFSYAEKIEYALEFIDLKVQYLGEKHGILCSRKDLSYCFKDMPNSEDVRKKVNKEITHKGVIKVLRDYQKELTNLETNS